MRARTAFRHRAVTQRAFTLVELLTALAVGAVMAMIAYPMLADAMTSQRLRASGTDLMSSLLLARSEAIKRNANVEVRPKVGVDWASGWTVDAVATAEQFDAKDALGIRVKVQGAPPVLTYRGNGRLTTPGVARIAIADTDARATTRCLVVDPSGVPTLSLGTGSLC